MQDKVEEDLDADAFGDFDEFNEQNEDK